MDTLLLPYCTLAEVFTATAFLSALSLLTTVVFLIGGVFKNSHCL